MRYAWSLASARGCLLLPRCVELAGGHLQGGSGALQHPALIHTARAAESLQPHAGGSRCLSWLPAALVHAESCTAASSRSLCALRLSEGASSRLVAPRRVQQQELGLPAHGPAPFTELQGSLSLMCIAASHALSALCLLPWPADPAPGLLSLNAFVINIGFCQWCNTAPPALGRWTALGIQHIPQPKQQGWQLPTVPLEEQVGPCLWCICCLTSSWRSALSAWDRSPCTSICTSLRRVSASVALN